MVICSSFCCWLVSVFGDVPTTVTSRMKFNLLFGCMELLLNVSGLPNMYNVTLLELV